MSLFVDIRGIHLGAISCNLLATSHLHGENVAANPRQKTSHYGGNMVTRKIKLLVSVLALIIAATPAINAQESMSSKSSKSKSSSAAVPTSDAEIQKCIADRLARASSLEGQTINVAVSGGDATLTGSVKKGLQKGTASRVAKVKACGAKQVTNNLTVETLASTKKSTAQKH